MDPVPILLSLLVLAGCGQQGIGADWKRIEPGVAAIDFELPQLDGPPVKLSDYRGRVVVMEFWATWCGPCRFSLPSLEVIYKRYRDRGMTVLLINEGEEAEVARKWAEKRFTAPILLDRDQAVGARYRVRGIPRLFIVDQAGNLAYAHEGYGGGLERNLTLILDEFLAPPAPAADG
ncbi:MAG: TlpA family protein disulfide reductase [Candidatus Omnitrophica bacterium]|nr:TlpA family protein disulfide reductase [Candidatus Omnitrophota bacterium]